MLDSIDFKYVFSKLTTVFRGKNTRKHGMMTSIDHLNIGGVKRIQVIQDSSIGTITDWVGHKEEGKLLFAAEGSFLVNHTKMGVVAEFPEPYFHRNILSSAKPSLLWVPLGNYVAIKALTHRPILVVLSTLTEAESKAGELRLPWDKWGADIWEEEEKER